MIPVWIRLLLLTLWICIQVIWTVTGKNNGVKTSLTMLIHLRIDQIAIFEIICVLQLLLPEVVSIKPNSYTIPLEVFGAALAILGTALASWARITMGTNWGRPAQLDIKTQSNLVTHGPFRFSRNPIYVGLFLLFIGQQLALRSYLLILTIPFILAIREAVAIEESLLAKHFGSAYVSYSRFVPRFL